MQVNLKTHIQRYLIIALLAITVTWTIGYILGQRSATLSSDFAYIPLTTILTITAFFQVYQIRKEHKNITQWYVFAVFASAYAVAQHIWSLNEIILDQKPFPSFADIAYIIDTASLALFLMLFIKSKKQFISKKMFIMAILSSFVVISISSYFFALNYTGTDIEQISTLVYLVLDSIALAPATIGITMYFRNKFDFSSFLICFSMIPLVIGDILFQITTTNGMYYSGFIPDLFYYIQITLLIFGVYILSNQKIEANVSESQK